MCKWATKYRYLEVEFVSYSQCGVSAGRNSVDFHGLLGAGQIVVYCCEGSGPNGGKWETQRRLGLIQPWHKEKGFAGSENIPNSGWSLTSFLTTSQLHNFTWKNVDGYRIMSVHFSLILMAFSLYKYEKLANEKLFQEEISIDC